MLSINTSNNKSRRQVEIDGVVFTVRKTGAGEELVLMQKMRELQALQKKYEGKDVPDSEQGTLLNLSQELLNIMGACYDDGGDGSKAQELINKSSWEDLKDYHDYIFGETSATTEPAAEAKTA